MIIIQPKELTTCVFTTESVSVALSTRDMIDGANVGVTPIVVCSASLSLAICSVIHKKMIQAQHCALDIEQAASV